MAVVVVVEVMTGAEAEVVAGVNTKYESPTNESLILLSMTLKRLLRM